MSRYIWISQRKVRKSVRLGPQSLTTISRIFDLGGRLTDCKNRLMRIRPGEGIPANFGGLNGKAKLLVSLTSGANYLKNLVT